MNRTMTARPVRLVVMAMLASLLAMGFTVASGSAPALADAASCTQARQTDSAAAANVAQKSTKLKKAKRQLKKARKVAEKSPTVKHKKAVKKAKAKKKRAKKAMQKAQGTRSITVVQVTAACSSTGQGTPTTPTSTPGVSPLAPLCAQLPQLKPLCDATTTLGNTSPLQPLCTAIPQLAPLCAVKPGDLSNPAAVTALLAQIKASFPAQGAPLLQVVIDLVTSLLSGDAQGVAAALGTTPQALRDILVALGLPLPPLPLP